MDTNLIGGPYICPRFRLGGVLKCEYHGDVRVIGISSSPIQWPVAKGKDGLGRRLPVLCGDLIKAVRRESASAICYHWGVSRTTVTRWRRVLSVPMFNEGTLRLWSKLQPQRLSPEALKRGARAPKIRRKALTDTR